MHAHTKEITLKLNNYTTNFDIIDEEDNHDACTQRWSHQQINEFALQVKLMSVEMAYQRLKPVQDCEVFLNLWKVRHFYLKLKAV